jgi:riboflavin-specific deaminase-like protein
VELERLYPRAGTATPAQLVEGLGLAELAPAERPYLVLNMVASLDGKATIDGRTKELGGQPDNELFHELRGAADAIMAGAGTVREERYGRTSKDPGREPPMAVVVSARMQLPADLPLLQAPDQRVVIVTGAPGELEGVKARVEYMRVGDDLTLAMAKLREDYGVRSLLCEGGPTLNSHLLAASLVDELFLTLAPSLAGGEGGKTIVDGPPLPGLTAARLVSLYEAEGELLTRWQITH